MEIVASDLVLHLMDMTRTNAMRNCFIDPNCDNTIQQFMLFRCKESNPKALLTQSHHVKILGHEKQV